MQTIFYRISALGIVVLCSALSLFGQKREKPPEISQYEVFAVHPRIGVGGTFYSANFNAFQGAIDCGLFTGGSGFGFNGSLGFERRFGDNIFLGLGVGIINRSGSMVVSNFFPVRADTVSSNIVNVETENKLEATLSYLEIQPELRYTLVPNFIRGPLRAVGAIRVAFPVTSTFKQAESIIAPSNAVFAATRTQVRNVADGDISSRNSMVLGAEIGIENLLAVSSTNFFSQQLIFDYNFSDFTKDAPWKAMAVRFEAGFRFSFISEPEPPPVVIPEKKEEPKRIVIPEKPVVVEKPKPELGIKLQIAKESKTENSMNAKLEAGDELSATAPLVNTVFFEQNNAEIPTKYKLEKGASKPLAAVSAHRFILLDIAEIVRTNPKAKIILHGSTSGNGDESEGVELAKKRAESVKTALLNLGVPEKVITVRSSLLPENRSNQEYEEGREENRRVDIIVQNAPLQEYVAKRKYAELNGSIKALVTMKNFPSGTVSELSMNVTDSVMTFSSSAPIEIPFRYRLNETSNFVKVKAHLEAKGTEMHATDSALVDIAALPSTDVDLRLDNFEPILRFDYNSSELSDANKELMRQMLKVLPKGSTITVLGSSDALGSEKRNQELSAKRAKAIEDFIRSVAGNSYKIESSGAPARFNENTPEGRFLNRSIRIRVSR